MVETLSDYRKKLLNNKSAFSNVLRMLQPLQLLEARLINQSLADQIPHYFNEVRYDCGEEFKHDGTFLAQVTRPKILKIEEIDGTENHLQQIDMLTKEFINTVEYLKLSFMGNEFVTDLGLELAKGYAQLFVDR